MEIDQPEAMQMDSTSAASATLTAEEIIVGLHSIPQELYDKIHDLVFLPSVGPLVIYLTKDYKPPVQMQINQRLRDLWIRKHYRHLFTDGFEDPNKMSIYIPRWVASLAPEAVTVLEPPWAGPAIQRQHLEIVFSFVGRIGDDRKRRVWRKALIRRTNVPPSPSEILVRTRCPIESRWVQWDAIGL